MTVPNEVTVVVEESPIGVSLTAEVSQEWNESGVSSFKKHNLPVTAGDGLQQPSSRHQAFTERKT